MCFKVRKTACSTCQQTSRQELSLRNTCRQNNQSSVERRHSRSPRPTAVSDSWNTVATMQQVARTATKRTFPGECERGGLQNSQEHRHRQCRVRASDGDPGGTCDTRSLSAAGTASSLLNSELYSPRRTCARRPDYGRFRALRY